MPCLFPTGGCFGLSRREASPEVLVDVGAAYVYLVWGTIAAVTVVKYECGMQGGDGVIDYLCWPSFLELQCDQETRYLYE